MILGWHLAHARQAAELPTAAGAECTGVIVAWRILLESWVSRISAIESVTRVEVGQLLDKRSLSPVSGQPPISVFGDRHR